MVPKTSLKTPAVDRLLVEWLESVFPPHCHLAGTPLEDLAVTYRHDGQQHVIRKLRSLLTQQEEAAREAGLKITS